MQKIIPNIWCDGNAREMAEFYTGVFRSARICGSQSYPTEGLPDFQQHLAGQDLMVDMEIAGLQLSLINADDHYRPNPAVNFMVNVDPAEFTDAEQYNDQLWSALAREGRILMDIGEYPFSQRYGWVEDKYGLNWQLILTRPENEPRPHIIPALMFCGAAQGHCAEAVDYYCELIADSAVGRRVSYPDDPHQVMFSEFQLAGQWFTAMDSGVPQDFTFDGGISFLIQAKDQTEIDQLWDGLAAQEQPCGWCVDRFGLVWQVIPANFGELMSAPNAYETMMRMTKIIVAEFGGRTGPS
ncbi:VOC family protein [Corynebacterium sp. H127]|uniref:VOC family protein n=1 Tax=Corynebacterium sp. H127 TaxID=3133418 RepID=UPI0030AE8C58